MFKTFEQARGAVLEKGIEVIDLKFCDLWGHWHHLTIPASQFEPRLMEEGIGFDGSSVGLKSVKAGDMVLVPDLDTAFLDPFWESPTISFICRTLEADTHAIFANDPRNIAIRAEEYMKSTGIAGQSLWGPEFEFYIFAWDGEQRARIKPLPASLNEALTALERDHAFLTQGGVFSQQLLQQWVDYKRQSEYFAVRNRPHPFEMSLYFDV